MSYCREVYEETFPSDTYARKKTLKKELAKVQRMATQEAVELTEEEIEKVNTIHIIELLFDSVYNQIQEEIPEWKSKSLISLEGEGKEEKPSAAKVISQKLKRAINNTAVAQKFYKSEEYKEYEDFRANMTQFKADLKDHMHQSENVLVQGSLTLIVNPTT